MGAEVGVGAQRIGSVGSSRHGAWADLHSRSGRTSHLPGNAVSMGERPVQVAPARERSSNAMNLALSAQDRVPHRLSERLAA
jgi:hypothetical protein